MKTQNTDLLLFTILLLTSIVVNTNISNYFGVLLYDTAKYLHDLGYNKSKIDWRTDFIVIKIQSNYLQRPNA